jgi:hypothetical protein
VGTLLVGDPKHITSHHVGRVQNLRLRQWRRTHLPPCQPLVRRLPYWNR